MFKVHIIMCVCPVADGGWGGGPPAPAAHVSDEAAAVTAATAAGGTVPVNETKATVTARAAAYQFLAGER